MSLYEIKMPNLGGTHGNFFNLYCDFSLIPNVFIHKLNNNIIWVYAYN